MLADDEKELVLVSDQRVSFGDFSSDNAVVKTNPILPDWMALVAGNDIGSAGPIIRRARRKLRQQPGLVHEADAIAEAIYEECRLERERKIDAKVLERHKFSADTFMAKGKKLCTEAVYYDLYSKINEVSLSLAFLVCGFDERGNGHIRLVTPDETPQDYDEIGFYAIGTGANAALSSLCHSVEHLSLNKHCNSGEVAYYALSAKFMAESASDVGDETWLVAIRKGQQSRYITPLYGMEYIRKTWEKRGAPRFPKGIDSAISDLMMTLEDSVKPSGIRKAIKYSPKLKRMKIMQSSTSQK